MAEQNNNSYPTISEKIGGQLGKNLRLHFPRWFHQLISSHFFQWLMIIQQTAMSYTP